jgi:hypothetical protein
MTHSHCSKTSATICNISLAEGLLDNKVAHSHQEALNNIILVNYQKLKYNFYILIVENIHK